MTSIRARLVKKALRLGHRSSFPQKGKLHKERRNFERVTKLLTPSLSTHYMKKAPIPNVTAYWITPPNISAKRTILYLHGGGFVKGSTRGYLQHLIRTAKVCDARVLSIDYRLAPEHPYPAALDDVLAAWKYLLKDTKFRPESVAVMGESAGGSLALATALRIRDENLPLPGAVVLLSAALDMSLTGESITTREKRELILNKQKIGFYADLYAADASRTLPYLSPVVADLTGLPPMLIHVGSEEMLYSDSIRIADHAKRDNVPYELHIGEGMWHGWHVAAGVVPEAKRDMLAVGEFVKRIIN